MEQSINDSISQLSISETEITKLKRLIEDGGYSSTHGETTEYTQEELDDLKTEVNTEIGKVNEVITVINTQFGTSIPQIDEVE